MSHKHGDFRVGSKFDLSLDGEETALPLLLHSNALRRLKKITPFIITPLETGTGEFFNYHTVTLSGEIQRMYSEKSIHDLKTAFDSVIQPGTPMYVYMSQLWIPPSDPSFETNSRLLAHHTEIWN